MLFRGLTKRCARCGSGKLFRRWFSMVPDCPRCGYHFEREEGFFLGAFVVNFAVIEAVLMLFIAVAFAVTLPDPPVWTLAGIGVVISIAVPLLTYPVSKTVWTAFDLIMRKGFGESYVDVRQPGFAKGRAASPVPPGTANPASTASTASTANTAASHG